MVKPETTARRIAIKRKGLDFFYWLGEGGG